MKKTICVLVLLTLLAGIGIASAEENVLNVEQISQQAFQHGMKGFIHVFEQVYRLFMRLSLPPALDSIYNGSTPETPSGSYIPEMFKMADPMIGITTDVQEGDMTNATVNFNQFKAQYLKVSKMVPQWQGYWDIKLVNKLGADLKNNNVPAVFQDVGMIGQGCSKCHANEMPQVWARYYWKDFDTVNVSTPEGNLSWTDAMTKYLDGAYSGTGSNIREGKQQDALNSSMLFKSMMLNFKQACNDCHKTPRYYFVSDDVMANVTQMGNDIQASKLADAETIRGQLGEEVCFRCHVVHMPAQDMKNKMNTINNTVVDTIRVSPEGAGTVQAVSAVGTTTTPPTTTLIIPVNSEVKFKAIPNEGFKFDHWLDTWGISSSFTTKQNPWTDTMSSSDITTAVFVPTT